MESTQQRMALLNKERFAHATVAIQETDGTVAYITVDLGVDKRDLGSKLHDYYRHAEAVRRLIERGDLVHVGVLADSPLLMHSTGDFTPAHHLKHLSPNERRQAFIDGLTSARDCFTVVDDYDIQATRHGNDLSSVPAQAYNYLFIVDDDGGGAWKFSSGYALDDTSFADLARLGSFRPLTSDPLARWKMFRQEISHTKSGLMVYGDYLYRMELDQDVRHAPEATRASWFQRSYDLYHEHPAWFDHIDSNTPDEIDRDTGMTYTPTTNDGKDYETVMARFRAFRDHEGIDDEPSMNV